MREAVETMLIAASPASGNGSGAHLAGELFSQAVGMKMTHVPYKGVSPALPDLFSGQVAIIFDSVQTMMPQVRAGKLKALAITSPARWPAAPEVPTMAQAGYPAVTASSWIGLLAPARTPKDVVGKLSGEMDAVLHQPEVKARLIEYGIDPVGGSAGQFQSFIQEEAVRWGPWSAKGESRPNNDTDNQAAWRQQSAGGCWRRQGALP
ncbi:tripartite tricarboxylate transporter substrate-binding protein [Cupriavidus basilensis]|uniref:Tripartite tricarboxylate transporter substrate-binding protein n=1 Tax=Cupriavidus basilensis TaxID=68895 RepID=A0ABT6ANR4_9BURK|nr:tripartite tricarboxylate transporter substrate-binding protein [Cupriavidus basilensis]MDF3834261.1 tripartite tricarboxylate transporter substrate-binding protein [Cupriavidus basilensis]